MSEKEQPPIMDQKLCVNGCGFFGSSQTSHMCSKCWKDAMTKTMREADANTDGASGSSTPIAPEIKPSVEEAMDTSSSNSSSSSPSQQPQSGADSPQQVPPPPSPASPDMVVDPAPSTPKPTDVTVPPQPPSTITAMEEVVDDKMISTTPTASEPAEVPVTATVSSMAVSEEDQGVAALSDGARGDGAGGAGVAAAAPAAVSMPTIDRRVAAGAATAIETPVTRPVQKSRKRCFACHKKVGYTGITCRCGYVFCSLHRYPEQHSCTFDFKTADRKDLEKTVVGGGQFSKIERL